GPGEYCSFLISNSCGAAGLPGFCLPRPDPASCGASSGTVCGCDGKNYGSICLARASGTGWDYMTPCKPCHSDDNQCAPDQFCAFPQQDICGTAGTEGRCTQRSFDCGAATRPVCGCDGKTYRNACAAHEVGVVVKSDGPCS